jgi:hypothetical protein
LKLGHFSEKNQKNKLEVDGGRWRSMEVDGKLVFTTFATFCRFSSLFQVFGQIVLKLVILIIFGPFGPKCVSFDTFGSMWNLLSPNAPCQLLCRLWGHCHPMNTQWGAMPPLRKAVKSTAPSMEAQVFKTNAL